MELQMAITIENLQNKLEVSDKINELINKAVELSLGLEKFEVNSEISIMLVDDDKIREINREYRHIDRATDVLSFPMVDMAEGQVISDTGDFDMDENLLLLGDIVISMEMAEKQAEEYGHSFERELAFLVTHGVFHLLGYDHEGENEGGIMFEKQEKVLGQMGLERE